MTSSWVLWRRWGVGGWVGVVVGRHLWVGTPALAGHNRWSKVKNVKGPRDAARGRLFQRLTLLLRTAAREGGCDPSLNPQLANVVQQCRANNMPKASIQAAIQAGSGGAARRVLLEARGPGGSPLLLLELLSRDPRRSQEEIRGLLSRHGGSLSEGARHGFEELGVVLVAPRDRGGHPVSMERALEAALEAGAQDVREEEEEEEEEEGEREPVLKFICPGWALQGVRGSLEASGLLPLSASTHFLPLERVPLPEGSRVQVEKLLQALSTHPDVTRLFHNSL